MGASTAHPPGTGDRGGEPTPAARRRPPAWTDPDTLEAVRPEVRAMLESAPSFARLREEEKRDIASKMVKVASYLANPDGVLTEPAPDTAPPPPPLLARAKADEDPVRATQERLSRKPGQVGAEFVAGGVREGVEQFGELVKKVDFPKFVSGLIKGVFQAIVESSIEQMRAYGDLLANVAKTVDQFAQDNITENNARDWLAETFPDALDIGASSDDFGFGFAEGETPEPTAQLTAKTDDPETLTAVSKQVGLEKPVTDLSDPNEELRLVLGARLQMARMRQQLLASMIILGINRIVVTDGHISAKVIFDMRASDVAARRARASMHDRQRSASSVEANASYGSWYSPVKASVEARHENEHVATVQSSVDDTSESKAEVKARLSGDVRVNFKSDYFPMEKLASPDMIAAIQGNATPPEKAVGSA